MSTKRIAAITLTIVLMVQSTAAVYGLSAEKHFNNLESIIRTLEANGVNITVAEGADAGEYAASQYGAWIEDPDKRGNQAKQETGQGIGILPHASWKVWRDFTEPADLPFVNAQPFDIWTVIPGSPAEKAGIKAGDKLIAIKELVNSGPLFDQMEALKKLKSQKITCVIERNGAQLNIPVTSAPMLYGDVVYTMIDKKTGYLRIQTLGVGSAALVSQAMDAMKGMGMQKLILDLRGAQNGYIGELAQISEVLMKKGTLAYRIWNNNIKTDYIVQRGNLNPPALVVLTDDTTQDAPAALAWSIQQSNSGLHIGNMLSKFMTAKQAVSAPGVSGLVVSIKGNYWINESEIPKKPLVTNGVFEFTVSDSVAGGPILIPAIQMPLKDEAQAAGAKQNTFRCGDEMLDRALREIEKK